MKPALDRSAAPLVVVTFYPTLTIEEARAHFQELGDAAEELGRIGVVVDLSNAPSVSPSLWRLGSQAMREVLGRCGERLVGVAHVVRSAPARAMLAAVQWLAPPPFPTLVTASSEDARSWVFARLGRTAPFPGKSGDKLGGARHDARAVGGLARTLITAAQALNVPFDDGDLRAVGIGRADLVDLDTYVPHAATMQLHDLLVSRAGDPNFGLRAGADFADAACFGVVGVAARASANLGDAIARTVRHARLIDENVEMGLSDDAGGAHIAMRPLPPLEWPRQHAEFLLAAFLTLLRSWTGLHLAAIAVGFRHPCPGEAPEHARFFGCPPSFGADQTFIVIPNALLAHKLPHGDPVQGRYFEARLEELARARGVASGPLADVRAATLRQLSQGTPTVASIAGSLGMSSRTLQRRLSERGVTFGDILDSARREAALAAIPRPGTSVQEVASSSGFVDVKAFRRAFVRWTGKSPSQYRRAPH
jgi:AraC-like DNA-binding protein